jgi:hypothetical protein
MEHCCESAACLIFDIHIWSSNSEADEFVKQVLSDVTSNSGRIMHLIARYSDNLLVGSMNDDNAPDHAPRRKTLALYAEAVNASLAIIVQLTNKYDLKKLSSWPSGTQETVRSMFRILDEVTMRLYFVSGMHRDGVSPPMKPSDEQIRLYREALPLLERLSSVIVASVAHHLIQTLEAFVSVDPMKIFALIARSVRSSEQGGYGLEPMAADLVVRIVERYLADHRNVFAIPERLQDLMDCLDVFVRAGWPTAQSLTFRLGEIWR